MKSHPTAKLIKGTIPGMLCLMILLTIGLPLQQTGLLTISKKTTCSSFDKVLKIIPEPILPNIPDGQIAIGNFRQDIENEEYNISFQEDTGFYQSPNRAQNLRFTYFADGFGVGPRQTKIPLFDISDLKIREEDKKYQVVDDWDISMKIKEITKGGSPIAFAGKTLVAEKSTASAEDANLKIEYQNTKEGMRQNFIVKQKPAGDKPLRVVIIIETPLIYHSDCSAVVFQNSDGEEKMRYSGLKVWDAENKPLAAYFSGETGGIEIVVEDANAIYPVTIDPLSTSADWSVESDQSNARLGTSVASAGDVNGDGYDDVIIGASGYDNGQFMEGRAFLFLGSATGLSNLPAWTAESDQVYAMFGNSVASAGDVNNDGFDDVIIGSSNYSNGNSSEGAAFVYFGSALGLSSTAGWSAEGNQDNGYFGCSVSSAGDVNNDGFDDVIMGAVNFDNGETGEGAAFLYLGSSEGLQSVPAWTAEGNQENAMFGNSVSTAGDVNGDGYNDVIVGANYYENGQTYEGAAFLYLGSATGLQSSFAWSAEGNQANAKFGYSVSTVGDINNDGYDDVVVGCYNYSNGQNGEGAAFAYYGSAAGLPPTANWFYESNQASAYFGNSVASAGDVNGDGFSDVVIGAYYYDGIKTDGGAAFIFHGTASGLSPTINWKADSDQTEASMGNSVSTAGDVNGDGFSDVIIGASAYNGGQAFEGKVFVFHGNATGLPVLANWSAQGGLEGAGFGYSVASAGDVNGDGFDDVIIGAPFFDNGQSNEGRAFLFLGTATGLLATASWTAESDMDNVLFGFSVSTAGDVNHDGFDDVIVGAPYYNDGQTNEGKAFVYHGSSTGLSSTPAWTYEPNISTYYFGFAVSTAGDVNGDGFSDVIIGGCYSDRVFVFHGSASGLSATYDWMDQCEISGSNFGCSVSTAGDVNGDGFSDVVIGAEIFWNGEYGEGKAYVYYGSATGLSDTPGWEMESNFQNAYFGSSVSSAGDVNGDGFSDVIVGARKYTVGGSPTGKVFLYYGSAFGLSTNIAWSAVPNCINMLADFGSSVSTAGDVDGDGFSDVIVGSYGYFESGIMSGKVFVYKGSPTGLSQVESWTAVGDQADSYFGSSVASAGDVNGDGLGDIIVGARYYNREYSYGGKTFVYYGIGQSQPQEDKTFTVRVFLQGLFNGTGMKKARNASGVQWEDAIADKINITFFDAMPPYDSVTSFSNVAVDTAGFASIPLGAAFGPDYYIRITHRNSVPTWSSMPVPFSGNTISYDFTDFASKALGNNLLNVSEKYVVYAGDVNQDGKVDGNDISIINTDASQFQAGYRTADVNGDGSVDCLDMIMVDNNAAWFVKEFGH